MIRLMTTIKTDVRVQFRNNLYMIGIVFAVIGAGVLAWVARPSQLIFVIPGLMLLLMGGSTLLYVSAMILFEKEQGTLNANMVSPMRVSEYLWSKLITLTALGTLEAIIIVGGSMFVMSFFETVTLPNIPMMILGVITMAAQYTLVGIILVVRYNQFVNFLIPMGFVAIILQLPFLYFGHLVQHWSLLIIPTSATAMFFQGAYEPLVAWEWIYAIGYTTALLIGLGVWAYRAFHTHIIMKVG